MDYVSGISIAQPRALTAAGYDLQEIGERLVDNYAKQVLDDGYFHADPHPGNIIIAGGKIAFIDLGMMGRLSSTYRHILRQMVMAVAAHNSSALKDGLLRLSEHRDYDDLDHSALLFDLDEIVETYGAASLDELDLSAFLTSLMALARRYDIELPGAMTMIARGMVTLEGVLDEFLPGISMIEIIKRHIRTTTPVASVARDELTTFARETHGALHGTLQALSEAGLAAKMLTRGQLKLNLDVAGSQDPIEDLSHIADRLSMAVIIAGLLIGSSIVYFAGDSPGIFGIPYLGFLGYLIAIVLALVVVRDVLKRRHHH
jgi:ubiquinone biosynthesis protein